MTVRKISHDDQNVKDWGRQKTEGDANRERRGKEGEGGIKPDLQLILNINFNEINSRNILEILQREFGLGLVPP